MAIEEKVNWTEYELVPVGLYEAEIVDVQETQSKFDSMQMQYRVDFQLDYKGKQGQSIVVLKWISKKLNPKSKLFELVAALDGQEPSKASYPGGVSGAELIGKKCRVMIQQQQGKDGNAYSKVDMFLPLEKAV